MPFSVRSASVEADLASPAWYLVVFIWWLVGRVGLASGRWTGACK